MAESLDFNGKRVSEILEIPLQYRSEEYSVELLDLTYAVPLFAKLREKHSEALHQYCCKYLTIERFSKNQHIYEVGDVPSKYYILLNGSVSLSKHLQKTKKIKLDEELSDDSSDEYEDDLPKSFRSRSRRVDIQPGVIFEFSRGLSFLNKERSQNDAVLDSVLEDENKKFFEFILQIHNVTENELEVKGISPGEDFGQDALFSNKPRHVNAIAKNKVELAVLTKANFKKAINEISKQKSLEMLDYLLSISIFSRWSKLELTRVLNFFKLKSFSKGQHVFHQGDLPESVYFIIKGEFSITKSYQQAKTTEKKSFNQLDYICKFETKKILKVQTKDLVIKGPKEILGAEDAINSSQFREYSCICTSAVAEVYIVARSDFFGRLLKVEAANKLYQSAKLNSLWLNRRSEILENHIIEKSFEIESPILAKSFNLALNSPKKRESVGFEISRRKIKTQINRRSLVHNQHNTFDSIPAKYAKTIHQNLMIPQSQKKKKNIHMVHVLKKNKRLAPPNFLISLREKHRRNSDFSELNHL